MGALHCACTSRGEGTGMGAFERADRRESEHITGESAAAAKGDEQGRPALAVTVM